MQSIKLINRGGNTRLYATDKGNISVVVCTNPNVYVKTGYYLRLDRPYPRHIAEKAYRSGKLAAMAAYKAIEGVTA
jgi:hypothetical protein